MVTFQHTGRVGIGTSSPQNILHLKSNDPKIYLEDGNAGTNEKVYVVYPAGSQYVLQTQTDAYGSGQQVYVVDRTGTTVDGQKWYINNTAALTLDSSGDATFEGNVQSKGELQMIGASGGGSNRLKATYNSSSGVAEFGAHSTGGSTSLQIGTSNSGTYAAALTLASTGVATFEKSITMNTGSFTVNSDTGKIYLGADDDMHVYHTGSHGYVLN